MRDRDGRLESVRYLPHTLRNFREIVLADLLRAQRLIERINDEIDPQFRIASPEGDWWIGITLSDDQRARALSAESYAEEFALMCERIGVRTRPRGRRCSDVKLA